MFRKNPKKYYCCICDDEADYEITNHGHLKLFWSCSEHDGEICLCKSCAKKLFKEMEKVLDKDNVL